VKMMKRLLALATALLLCCCCAAAETADGDVLVTVNGTPVTRAAFDNYLSNLASYYEYYGYDVSSAENAAYLRYMTLDTLIQLALMDQKLVEMNITLTDAETAAAEQEGRDMWSADVSNTMSYYGATEFSTEAERAAAMVKALSEMEALGYTEETYVRDALNEALYVKLEKEMVSGAAVTDAQIDAYYAQLVTEDRDAYADDAAAFESAQQMNAIAMMYGMTDYYDALWYIPEGYRNVVHILLEVDEALLNSWYDLQASYEEQQGAAEEGGEITGEAVTEEEVENARLAVLASVQAKVSEIQQKLAEGAAFAELIPQYTADDALDTAEEIAQGVQVHMDSILFPAGYRDAAFALTAPGEVSEAFAADGGVYIVCYVGDAEGGPLPLTEELRQVLRDELLVEAESVQYSQTMNRWMAEAEIVYSDEAKAIMGAE